MSEEIKNKIDGEENVDNNLREIVIKAQKNKPLSKEEVKQLLDKSKDSVEFLKLIDKIEIPTDKYVVFTDGSEQLIYEDGEFFIVATTDSTKKKKKKKRSEAKDLYIEYFIKYQLNPIIKQKEMHNKIKILSKDENIKEVVRKEQKEIKLKNEKFTENIKEKEKLEKSLKDSTATIVEQQNQNMMHQRQKSQEQTKDRIIE